MNTHKHILVFISSSITLFGLFWICTFGDWHTVNALGDDSSIYLVDFDETAFDLYLKGYYPSDYTYADFRRDSIESMTSHYVATDSNNFTAIVDTIENDVLLNGWSVIDNFFEDAWLNLKTGDITVSRGFTDDFKHELDGRFKSSASLNSFILGSYTFYLVPSNGTISSWYGTVRNTSSYDEYFCFPNGQSSSGLWAGSFHSGCAFTYPGSSNSINSFYTGSISSGYCVGLGMNTSLRNAISAAFFGNDLPTSEPEWNGVGYYSNTPTNYSINLPALPAINWPSISTNNKTKYGVDFPDVDLTIDFQLPDSYYPKSVTYDTPYWLYNTDSTPVDWANVSFEDVTLPEVQLTDGDGSFFQALFNTLPLAFVPIFLGVILCYLIFLML